MIKLKQYGFECEYEIGVFLRMYFGNDADIKIETHFYTYDDGDTEFAGCRCRIEFCGKEFSADAGMEIQPYYDKDIVKKVYKNTVIESFCLAAEKFRHIQRPWGVMSGIRPAKNVRKLLEKYTKEEAVAIMRDIYHCSEEKIKLAFEVYKNEKPIIGSHDKKSAGLYIGIPFCPTRCSYCSFISSPIKVSGKYIPEYVELLCREIEKTGEVMDRLCIYPETIYIGGGTPTALSAEYIDKIFSAAEKNLNMSKVKEITLEAGRPDTITEEKLCCALRHNVNRISINPQSMHRISLDRIGRNHTPEDIEKSFALARKCGFDNINMDLIAGLPGEDTAMFRESLDRVCRLGSDNITVHTMCIKRAADMAKIKEAESEYAGEMLLYAAEKLGSLGYIPYYMYRQKNIAGNLENVGYAMPGKEGIYNVKIMEEIQHIIALGGGGSSKLVLGGRIERIFNFKDAAEYIRRFDEILSRKEKMFDLINEYEKSGE